MIFYSPELNEIWLFSAEVITEEYAQIFMESDHFYGFNCGSTFLKDAAWYFVGVL